MHRLAYTLNTSKNKFQIANYRPRDMQGHMLSTAVYTCIQARNIIENRPTVTKISLFAADLLFDRYGENV